MLFLACNSFFSAAKSSWELQTARFFLIVIVLSPMMARSQSHSFLLFSSGEKMENRLVTRWVEQFDRVCLAFCFMLFHVGRFEIPPNHVRLDSGIGNSSCQICCLPPSFASVYSVSFGRYIFLFLLQTRTFVFFSVRWRKSCIYIERITTLYWSDSVH